VLGFLTMVEKKVSLIDWTVTDLRIPRQFSLWYVHM